MPCKRHFAQLAILPLIFFTLCAYGADDDVRVLNYERIALDFVAPQSTGAMKTSTAISGMRFVAFGRSYNATLERNTAITVPSGSSAQVYRGAIDGRANSWLRITRIGEEVHGLVFDGAELLAIEPAATIGDDSASGAAIFRLADTQTDLGAEFCTALKNSEEHSALALFDSLSGESKAIVAELRKSGARTRLQLSALMDANFRSRYASDAAANDAIVSRVNNIDGIFSSQLGIEIELTSTSAPPSMNAASFNNASPDNLLQSIAKLRGESPQLYSTGVTHLFTGTDMDGRTIGIAYMDAVCGQKYAASLSEARDRGAWFDSLVAAHELGHTFGSPHDGEGECAATPATFLMASTINGNDKLSQCSLNRIQTRALTASCLIPIPVADLSVATISSDYRVGQNAAFALPVVVSNIGNAESLASSVEIAVPAALNVSAAKVENGACSIGAGVVACTLGTLAAAETRTVELTLNGTQVGTYSIIASARAQTDFNVTNNVSTGTIRVLPSVDTALSLTVPGNAAVDQSFDATFVVANKGTAAAVNITVDIGIPVGVSLTGVVQLDGVTCQLQFQILHCTTAELAAGRTLTATLALIARESGTHTLTAVLDGAYSDPQPLDNTVQRSISVTGPATATANAAQSSGESGGGALGIWLLGLLIGIAHLRSGSRKAH